MRILLSNDDGYFSPGIESLAQALSVLADITVVAPERDRSGASNSLDVYKRQVSMSSYCTADRYSTFSPTTIRDKTPVVCWLSKSGKVLPMANFC